MGLLVLTLARLAQGKDPSSQREHFWEELFLLKVNTQLLKTLIKKKSVPQLLELKPALNRLFDHACTAVSDHNYIRVANSMLVGDRVNILNEYCSSIQFSHATMSHTQCVSP